MIAVDLKPRLEAILDAIKILRAYGPSSVGPCGDPRLRCSNFERERAYDNLFLNLTEVIAALLAVDADKNTNAIAGLPVENIRPRGVYG